MLYVEAALRGAGGGLFMLEVGTKAPAFTLPDQNGNVHSLPDYAGKKVILYF